MDAKLLGDARTVEELASHAGEILKQVQRTGRPQAIAAEGKPVAVLLDLKLFEHLLNLVGLTKLLSEAEASVRAGKTRPADEVLDELTRALQVSR